MNQRELDIRKWHELLVNTQTEARDLDKLGFRPEAPMIEQVWKNFTEYTELLQRTYGLGTTLEYYAWERPATGGRIVDRGVTYHLNTIYELIKYIDAAAPL